MKGSSLLTGLIIILAIIVIGALVTYSVWKDLPQVLWNVGKQIWNRMEEEAKELIEKGKRFFGYCKVKGDMLIYNISVDNVKAMKQAIENDGVSTEAIGLTEKMLRKIVLANVVTSSTSDTLCTVEISEKELLQDTGYTNMQEYIDSFDDGHKKQSVKDKIWKGDAEDYTLYYITDSIYFFKDTKKMIPTEGGVSVADDKDISDELKEIADEAGENIKEDVTAVIDGGKKIKEAMVEAYNSTSGNKLQKINAALEKGLEVLKELGVEVGEAVLTGIKEGAKEAIKSGKDFNKDSFLQYIADVFEEAYNSGRDAAEDKYNGGKAEDSGTTPKPIPEAPKTGTEETEKVAPPGEKWYLGIMGKIEVTNAQGTGLTYVTPEDMKSLIEVYNTNSGLGWDLNRGEKEQNIASVYTKDEDGNLIVIATNNIIKRYKYKLKAPNLPENAANVEEKGVDDSTKYLATEFKLELAGGETLEQIAIPLELLLDFLNYTGSPEYVDKFIDFAVENTKATIKAYSLTTETHIFNKTKYSIANDYIYELYDMVDLGDYKSDNMRAYKDLIFNRKYNGVYFPGSIVDLKDYESIKEDGNGKYSVDYIDRYLKLAYDPAEDFTYQGVFVEENVEQIEQAKEWYTQLASINTWYGNAQYEEPKRNFKYYIDDKEVQESDCTGLNYDKIATVEKTDSSIAKVVSFYNETTAKAIYGGDLENNFPKNEENSTNKKYLVHHEGKDSNDIYDDVLKSKLGTSQQSNFDGWTARKLGEIANIDKGKKNDDTGVFSGSDYLYLKYLEQNKQKYKPMVVVKDEVYEESTELPKYDPSRIDDFLLLWKDVNGKPVIYKDVYEEIGNGEMAVGELFASAPEEFFDILESAESTQNLSEIFRYIMYKYTGVNYGVDDSNFNIILGTEEYAGGDLVVWTDKMDNKEMILDKAKLTKAIDESFGGNSKKNLLDNVDAFIKMQNESHVNATFAVAVAMDESGAGTNWKDIDPSTYNWMSVKGDYNGQSINGWKKYPSYAVAVDSFGKIMKKTYFGAGNYTVQSIAPIYCPATSKIWAQNVISFMTKMYEKVGIQVEIGGITSGPDQNGVTSFTSSYGKTYQNYKQTVNAYRTEKLSGFEGNYPKTNLKSAGCYTTSVSIIASGYKNDKSLTPKVVNDTYRRNGWGSGHSIALKHYTGLNWTAVYANSNTVKNIIVNEVKNKKRPAIVRFTRHGLL